MGNPKAFLNIPRQEAAIAPSTNASLTLEK